jgi:hypothetical protein
MMQESLMLQVEEMIVMTSFTNKVGFVTLPPPHLQLPESAGATTLQKTKHYFAGHQDYLTYLTLSFCHLNHRICLSCEDESSMQSQKLIVTCCSGDGQKAEKA